MTNIALVSAAGNATATAADATVARRVKALIKCIDEKNESGLRSERANRCW